VHIELSASDPQAAGEFYSKLFGWQVQTDEKYNYVMFQPGDGPGGGFNAVGEQTKAGEVIVYVDCDDIDSTLARAATLGATVIQPKMEIPGVGWIGVFKDPTGNPVGLYTSMHGQA
jgi:hypothetical protein